MWIYGTWNLTICEYSICRISRGLRWFFGYSICLLPNFWIFYVLVSYYIYIYICVLICISYLPSHWECRKTVEPITTGAQTYTGNLAWMVGGMVYLDDTQITGKNRSAIQYRWLTLLLLELFKDFNKPWKADPYWLTNICAYTCLYIYIYTFIYIHIIHLIIYIGLELLCFVTSQVYLAAILNVLFDWLLCAQFPLGAAGAAVATVAAQVSHWIATAAQVFLVVFS